MNSLHTSVPRSLGVRSAIRIPHSRGCRQLGVNPVARTVASISPTFGSRSTFAGQFGEPRRTSSRISTPLGASVQQPAANSVERKVPYSTSAETPTASPIIHDVFEKVTGTWQYIVADPKTSKAVIIDPVLDYDPVTQAISTVSADALLALASEKGYQIERILETHAHADHLTAASYLRNQLSKDDRMPPPVCIGKRITQVQQLFGKRYGVALEEYANVFGCLLEDDEKFLIGTLEATVLHLPGHTPDHLGYKIGDNIFCGDSIFHYDIGSARCDFPGGSSKALYASARKLLQYPDSVRIWAGHDYPPPERTEPVHSATVAEHRERNKHLMDGISEEEFVDLRTKRDTTLGEPRLLHQSLQMNIRAGRLPTPLEGRYRLLHLPLKLGGKTW